MILYALFWSGSKIIEGAALHCSPSMTGLMVHCWLVGFVTFRVWVKKPRTGQTKFTTYRHMVRIIEKIEQKSVHSTHIFFFLKKQQLQSPPSDNLLHTEETWISLSFPSASLFEWELLCAYHHIYITLILQSLKNFFKMSFYFHIKCFAWTQK